MIYKYYILLTKNEKYEWTTDFTHNYIRLRNVWAFFCGQLLEYSRAHKSPDIFLEKTLHSKYNCRAACCAIYKNIIFGSQSNLKPTIYCGYFDDIFVLAKDIDQVLKLRHDPKSNSVFNFTCELEKYIWYKIYIQLCAFS